MPALAREEDRKQVRLHPRHRLFVNEYLKTGNGRKACESLGYKDTYNASRILLRVPKIRRAIELGLERLTINAESVLQETAKLAFSNISDYLKLDKDGFPRIDFTLTTHPQFAAVQEISEDVTGGTGDGERRQVLRRKIKLQPKVQALEILADHLHLRDQRVELDIGENLANRLGGARHRTIDATPATAQLVIDTHSQDGHIPNEQSSTETSDHVVTTQAVTDVLSPESNSTPSSPSTFQPSSQENSLRMKGEGGGGLGSPCMENPKIGRFQDAGIVSGLARLGTIAGDEELGE